MVRDPRRLAVAAGAAPRAREAPGGSFLALRARAIKAAASVSRVQWTLVYLGFLAYAFVMLTVRFPLAQVALAVAVLGLLLQGRVRFPVFVVLFAMFLAWAALGLTSARYGELASEAWLDRAKLAVIAFVAVNAIRSRAQLRFAMLSFVVVFIAFPARSTIVMYLTGHRLFGRAVGPLAYSNPNDLAAVCLLMMAISFALFASEPKRSITRYGALAAVGTFVMITLMTQSRGAFLGMIVVLGPYAITRVRRDPKSLIAFAAAGILAITLAPAGVWERVAGLRNITSSSSLRDVDREGSAEQRFEILKTATRIVKANPVMGAGIGTYHFVNADYAPQLGRKDAHNTYLNVAAETGLVGLLLFLSLVVSSFVHARRARKSAGGLLPDAVQELRCLELGLLGFLVAGFFGSYAHINLLYVYMALLYACAEMVRHEARVMRQPAPAAPLPAPQPPRLAALRGR